MVPSTSNFSQCTDNLAYKCTYPLYSCGESVCFICLSTVSSRPQDGRARVVGGTSYGHSSFGINPLNYTPTNDHREPLGELGASVAAGTSTEDPQGSVSATSHPTSHLSQASVRVPADDDTLVAAGEEAGACRDKLLLTKNSIGMSDKGRPVLNTSMSEGSVVGLQQQVRVFHLHVLGSFYTCTCACTLCM